MGLFSGIMLYILPEQVRLPSYDSGAPSPRIIPGVMLVGILICSIALIIQSVVLKKEKIYVFEVSEEKPAILIIAMLCGFSALILNLGFMIAVCIFVPVLLFYFGERKPFIYIFTLALGFVIYMLFTSVLNISLPSLF